MLSEKEFTEAYESYQDLLYFILKNFGITGADADDCYQEAFVRMWRFRHRYTDRGELKAFCVTVTRNAAINYLKKQKITPGYKGLDLEKIESIWGTDDEHFEEMYSDNMRRALGKVPAAQRAVLVEYAENPEMRIEDVAEKLGIPMGTALSRSHRGRAALRKYYKEAS